jgi:hypothetical protein
VAGRADARRAYDVETDVTLLADGGLSGVKAHPHLDLDVVRPLVLCEGALRADCAGDRIARPCEGEEERVTLSVDLATTRRSKRLAKDAPLLAEQIAVVLAELP